MLLLGLTPSSLMIDPNHPEALFNGDSSALTIFAKQIDQAAADDPLQVPPLPHEIRARIHMAIRDAGELSARQIEEIETCLAAEDWLTAIEHLLVSLRDSGSQLRPGRVDNLMNMVRHVDVYRDLDMYYL